MIDKKVDCYTATALQLDCYAINNFKDRESASKRMLERIKIIGDITLNVDLFTQGFNGTKTRLFVLPEYFLSSFPLGESIKEWQTIAAIDKDGPEYDALRQIAQNRTCYLSGNVYEKDENFKDLYFQTSFVIGPNGDVVLRYRRLISLFAPSPYDVLEKYIGTYGADSIFPVVDTEIGKIGCIASEEILYPEIARCLAMKGVELICHSTSEVGSPAMTPKEICRRARAVENMCYVVSANTASIKGIAIPEESTGGMSKIVDFKGNVQAEAYTGESFVANATIDIQMLRDTRKKPGMTNLLSRQPVDLYASEYAKRSGVPANAMVKDNSVVVPDRAFFLKRQGDVIAHLAKHGVL